MPKSITITISDAGYDSLRSAASATHATPEEVASAVIEERFDGADEQRKRFDDQFIALLREQGLLIAPHNLPPSLKLADIPPADTPERREFEERLADELSDALEASGKTILDLVER